MLSLILIGPQLTQFLLNILGSKGKREKKKKKGREKEKGGKKRKKKEETKEQRTGSIP